MPTLFADISGITQPISISVDQNHNNATSIATINTISTTLDIGDPITIDLGFIDNHGAVFTGWVKGVDRQVPEDVYIITAQDKLVQAIDYFIVAPSPDSPYNYGKGITAEDLVANVLELADLTIFDFDPTLFSFGVHNDVEVNLVSSYDFAKTIADIVTWSLWCDRTGNIYFCNRKPFVMESDPGQPGWVVDTPVNPVAYDDYRIVDFTHKRSEKDLRNKVVVYGEGGITATASRATTYDPSDGLYKQILPADFYKAVVASYGFIGTDEIAQNTANYNLHKLNRITEQVSITMLGDPTYEARQVIKLREDITGLNESNWYVYGCSHNWSQQGYTVQMDLRR